MPLGALLVWAILSAPPVSVDAQAIWEKRCQQCHGADGRAHTRTGSREDIDDFTTAEWQTASTDEHIRETVTEGSKGNPKMKSFKTVLTPDEIEALIAFIRSLPTRAQQANE